MPERDLIDGEDIRMGGRTWTVPPLSWGAVERLQKKLAAATSQEDQVAVNVEAVYLALKRNYPEVTEEQVKEELLDLRNMEAVFRAVWHNSGIKFSGEAPASL